MNRLLYVCLDGLADDPIPELGGRTPLEAAHTPFLDALARQGRTGTVTTVGEGIAPESDIAVFAILGYDPREEHPGRGVVEALGVGMDFRDGDLAYRVNFATAEWPTIIDRRVGRDALAHGRHRSRASLPCERVEERRVGGLQRRAAVELRDRVVGQAVEADVQESVHLITGT